MLNGCSAARGGTRWHLVVLDGTRWHSVALDGTRWHSVALNGTRRSLARRSLSSGARQQSHQCRVGLLSSHQVGTLRVQLLVRRSELAMKNLSLRIRGRRQGKSRVAPNVDGGGEALRHERNPRRSSASIPPNGGLRASRASRASRALRASRASRASRVSRASRASRGDDAGRSDPNQWPSTMAVRALSAAIEGIPRLHRECVLLAHAADGLVKPLVLLCHCARSMASGDRQWAVMAAAQWQTTRRLILRCAALARGN